MTGRGPVGPSRLSTPMVLQPSVPRPGSCPRGLCRVTLTLRPPRVTGPVTTVAVIVRVVRVRDVSLLDSLRVYGERGAITRPTARTVTVTPIPTTVGSTGSEPGSRRADEVTVTGAPRVVTGGRRDMRVGLGVHGPPSTSKDLGRGPGPLGVRASTVEPTSSGPPPDLVRTRRRGQPPRVRHPGADTDSFGPPLEPRPTNRSHRPTRPHGDRRRSRERTRRRLSTSVFGPATSVEDDVFSPLQL